MKRTHKTIKEEQIHRIIKFLNRSAEMVNYIRDTHDVRLSDVRRLEDGMVELADMFGGEKQYGNKVIEPFQTLADNSKALLMLNWDPKGDLPSWIEKYKQKLGI